MHLRFWHWLALLALTVVTVSVHATRYEITTTSDLVASDGHCSVREAVEAINTRESVKECEAGTGTNRIELAQGEDYILTQMLDIGGQATDQNNDPISPRVTFTIKDFDEEQDQDRATLDMDGSSRAFWVHDTSRLELSNISVIDGDAGSENGGLIYLESEAGLQLTDNSELNGGSAIRGGLVYAAGSSISGLGRIRLTNGQSSGPGGAIYLAGQSTLDVSNTIIEQNETQDRGGALAVSDGQDPGEEAFSGLITIDASSISNNTAVSDGGAFYVPDLPAGKVPQMVVQNTTIIGNNSDNGVAAFYWGQADGTPGSTDDNEQLIVLNNMTIANNNSGGSSGSIYVKDDGVVQSDDSNDRIINSVIVGDLGGDSCSSQPPDNALTDGNPDTVSLDWNLLGSGCDIGGMQTSSASIQVLANHRGNCTNSENSASPGCEPAPLEPFPGYLPAPNATPTAREWGNPTALAQNSCARQDQRGISRLDNRCDSGSIEFEVAVGEVDEFEIVWGETSELDVLKNDVGDSRVDCGDVPGGETCAEILIPPGRPSASVSFEVNSEGYPVAVYNPGKRYHGLDRFAYRVHKDAFDATSQNRDVEAVTNVVSQPEHGLQESDSVDQLGAIGGFLSVLFALVSFRRLRAVVPFFVLIALSKPGMSAEIVVDSLGDQANRQGNGDGVCTLREAIDSSVDDQVNTEPACENGADGNDTIVLPRGCITLTAGALQVSDPVTIRGQKPHDISASGDLTGAECSPNNSNNSSWTEGTIVRARSNSQPVASASRIFEATAALELEDVTLAYGFTSGDGGGVRADRLVRMNRVELFENRADGRGGALYLAGDPDPEERQETTIRNSYFLANSSDHDGNGAGDGGAVAMAATAHEIEIGSTTFENNSAGEASGAVDFAMDDGSLWLVNSTLVGNIADDGPGGADLRQVVADTAQQDSGVPTVNILNSTIVSNTDNSGGPGGIDVGSEQTSGGQPLRRFYMNNSILAGNANNECSSAGSSQAQPFDQLIYSLLSDSATTCMGDDEYGYATISDPNLDGVFPSPPVANLGADQDEFVAPNLAVDDSHGSAGLIEDNGNPEELASGVTGDRTACRKDDVRGLPRTSGSACDRGAFEVQVTTAEDDERNNKGSEDSRILIDVLENDSTDPARGFEIDPTSVTWTNINSGFPQTPGIELVYKAFPEVVCGDQSGLEKARQNNPNVDFDPDDFSCGIVFDPARIDPLDRDSPPYNAYEDPSCGVLPLEFKEEDNNPAFQYRFVAKEEGGSGQETSNLGNVYLTIDNLSPRIKPVTVTNDPGEKVVIKLSVTDPFGGEIDYSSLELQESPEFADVDENGDVVGTGVKFNEPHDGYITYVPRDKTKSFRERFSVQISDSCGDNSNSAAIVVRYPQEDTSGGDAFGGGSTGCLVLVAFIGLGSFRRRLGAPARWHP